MITANPFQELASMIREVRDKQDQLEAKLETLTSSDEDDDLVTRHEKAKQLKVSLATLRNWEMRGVITPVRIGRRVYFKKGVEHPKSPTVHLRNF